MKYDLNSSTYENDYECDNCLFRSVCADYKGEDEDEEKLTTFYHECIDSELPFD